MTPMVKHAVKILSVAIDPVEYSFFDMSGSKFGTTEADPKYLITHRPPFEKNVIVWRGQTKNHQLYELIMLVMNQDLDEGIVCTVWKGPAGTKLRDLPSLIYAQIDGQVKYGALDEEEPISPEESGLIMGMVASWFESMDQKLDASQPVVRQTFTNSRKIAEGKAPSYDWMTVTVEPSKARAEHQGGTHASPRLHDRRGHMRRLPSGKMVWVKACKVGDVTRGIVFHDYEVRA